MSSMIDHLHEKEQEYNQLFAQKLAIELEIKDLKHYLSKKISEHSRIVTELSKNPFKNEASHS